MSYWFGTFIGGTFTDCVVIDESGTTTTGKAPSTPPDFSAGFFNAIEAAAQKLGVPLESLFAEAHALVHATTAGSNAVVQRTGTEVGLIATKGHGEAILIMRGGGRTKGLSVDELLDISGTYKPEPIVPPDRIREVNERIDVKGKVVAALNEEEVVEAARSLIDAGSKAIAISFLWSFANPEHELRAKQAIMAEFPGVFVSCSHEIASRMGEYYRTVATVLNCYVGPLMNDYTDRIANGAAQRSLEQPVLFAQSIGGAAPIEKIQSLPLFTVDSGPVAGVIASAALAEVIGSPNVITADMGGTTFDVSVISDGAPQRRDTTILNQYELYLPMLDVQSIGAGGGSIAWLDPNSETMKVGPQSAGALPGPICYARGGTEPTVTDANAVLGVLGEGGLLGGRQELDIESARAGVERLGEQLGLSIEETAAGIVRIVDHAMAEQIRRMTVMQGHDPREYSLIAFGGAGPAHAAALARELGLSTVVIPLGDTASVLSAMGTVSSDIVNVHDHSTQITLPFAGNELDAILGELREEAIAAMVAQGFSEEIVETELVVAMKYGAQVYDIETPAPLGITAAELGAAFKESYAGRYGPDSGYAPAGIEIIRERVYARAGLARPTISGGATSEADEEHDTREVYWPGPGAKMDTAVVRLPAGVALGAAVEGPAIIELPYTTVVVPPGDSAASDALGNLVITVDPKE